ncbi:DUF4192 domain-containing protein [Streptomyces sp. NRRL S-340]|uniref:DUF4192 domain-containing protein n=1 Tax=Streptomyces sp. NRRL S-340 TaxID=1463901 RepID=UPI00055DCCDE|nr:DUF4192 domain-containing protein [Streptomyces sp. NRRL S-340]
MTNHSETTGPFGNGHITYEGPGPEHQVTLRTPAELADALPYLLGYRPDDSIVLVALHDKDGRGRFGGRARLGIPPSRGDWPSAARQLAHGLITGSERRGAKPEQMVAFLCQEPASGESPRDVVRRLQPLAQKLRTECGRFDVPVIEALCISGGRFWSYCCPTDGCCPDEGRPMGLPGTSVLAAAATYAGIQVRGSLRELRARLLPWETPAARAQETALDKAGRALVPRILDEANRVVVAEETLDLAERVLWRFAEAPGIAGALPSDLRDDRLLEDEEAAFLILGLQDRTTRDRAAEWMEGEEAAPALRLWRALARRCVGSYGEHAAAPLALAGWVAWSLGDGLEAREALAMALGADPDYLFARLLHQACNEGLDPESVRRCLRAERAGREWSADAEPVGAGEDTGQDAAAQAAAVEDAEKTDAMVPQDAAVADAAAERAGETEEEGEAEGLTDAGSVPKAEDEEGAETVGGPARALVTAGDGSHSPAVKGESFGRRRRLRGDAPVADGGGAEGARPVTSRTDSGHPRPGASRSPGRTRPRAGSRTKGDVHRRGGCRPTGKPRADRPEDGV